MRVGVRPRCGRHASNESRSADDHHGQANDSADAIGKLERSCYRPVAATGQQHGGSRSKRTAHRPSSRAVRPSPDAGCFRLHDPRVGSPARLRAASRTRQPGPGVYWTGMGDPWETQASRALTLRDELCEATCCSCEAFAGWMSVVDKELLVVPGCPNDRAPCGPVHPRIALDGRRSMLIDADPGGASERLCMLEAYEQLATGMAW